MDLDSLCRTKYHANNKALSESTWVSFNVDQVDGGMKVLAFVAL